jgi:hypothetical protein
MNIEMKIINNISSFTIIRLWRKGMKKRKANVRNYIIASVLILATVFTAFFIIYRHNAEQKRTRGVFVMNEYISPVDF